jgi:hypothetical protein
MIKIYQYNTDHTIKEYRSLSRIATSMKGEVVKIQLGFLPRNSVMKIKYVKIIIT